MKRTRALSAILAVLFAISAFPLSLLKANADAAVTVETRAGQEESVAVSESVTTDADGVKTTEQTAEDYTTSSGMIVDYSGTNVEQPNGLYEFEDHYTSQDANDTYEAEGGSDKFNEYHAPASEIGVRIGEDDIGKSNTVTGEPVKVIETTGDVRESENDGIYDYTVKERITQSVIKVTTKSLEITDAHGEVNPDDMEYLHTEIVGTADIDFIDKIGTNASNLEPMGRLDRENMGGLEPVEGYEYVMIGSDQWSKFWTAYLFSTPNEVANPPQYPGPEEEPVFTDANGNNYYARRRHTDFATATSSGIKFYKFYLQDGSTITAEDYFADKDIPDNEKFFIAAWGMIELFTMSDKNGNMVTTYCADVSNPEEKGWGYNIGNLEDAHYYGEEQANHIRAVCKKGYWGTESGFGSLAALKQTMRESGEFTDEEIERLTDGMAMNAMQCAIWTYSNYMSDMVFLSAHDVKYWRRPYGSITRNGTVASQASDEAVELILKLYRYFVALEPEAIPEDDVTTENTIINEKNFLKSVNLTITGKPGDHENNKDADKTNDIYTVDLEIAFKVKPLEENGDDLVLEIQDQNGETIVKTRIAGTVRPGEVPATVISDGVYKIEGLHLQEGETALKFALSGSQNLNNDVYFFSSEVRDGEDSQPMVGIAKGKRDVNIWMDISFELDVTDEELEQAHYWRTEQKIPHYVELPVEKDWQDAENRDGVRPEKITIHLFADGVEVKSVEMTPDENGNWEYTFTDLPQYSEDGTKEIVYTITEDPVPEYDDPEYMETEDGLIKIVNKHTPTPTEIPVKKEWQDDENRDGVRPEKITVHLLADGVEVASAEITPDADGHWEYTFTNLPKYRDGGVEIVYTIEEDPVPEYEAEIEQGTYTITNKHTPVPTEIPVKKEWQDDENRDGVRPEKITVHLLADGVEVASAEITPDADGHWEYTFTNLPKYRDGGVEIVYTIEEDPVPEYETEIDQGTYTITNKHVPKTIVAEGKKTWADNDNYEKKRPVKITIRLFADGVEIDSKVVTEEDGWQWKWEDLPKYKDGKEIKYTIKEDRVVGYVADITGFDVLNTYVPNTGDSSNLWLWATVFGLSLLAGLALFAMECMYRKRTQ